MSVLVSVIIPCYNVELYISKCIESILTQTYKNIEIICVDNNSTDKTFYILQEYSLTYPAIITVEKEIKKGAPEARNKGLSISKGEWVQFIDADDFLLPGKIEHQLKICISNVHTDLLVGSYHKLFSDGTERDYFMISKDPFEALAKVELGNTCSNLWKRERLIEVGSWKEGLKSSQEYELMFRMLKSKSIILYDPVPLTIVVQRGGSISSTNLVQNIIRRIELLSDIKIYLQKINYSNDIIFLVSQALFDVIRELYNYECKMAVEYYKRYVDSDFKPKISAATSKFYVTVFGLFGFYYTQKLNACYKKTSLFKH